MREIDGLLLREYEKLDISGSWLRDEGFDAMYITRFLAAPMLCALLIALIVSAQANDISYYNYNDMLARQSPRALVRHVLGDVAKRGLIGQHHYFITFETAAPNVRISQDVRDKFPQDITIALQHDFQNLVVTEQGFDVTLRFGGNLQRISVPFDSIKMFYDPSVKFELPLKP
jgi:hypothetical protein